LTDIKFSENENKLLQKGLKYNLCIPPKQQLRTLAIEAETAVNLLPTPDQDPIRYIIAKTLDKLANKTLLNFPTDSSVNQKKKSKRITINRIKNKLKQHAILTKADKGHSIIIVKKVDYDAKIQDFINFK
jgi:hypothetical protein